jgi:hypothetical protein
MTQRERKLVVGLFAGAGGLVVVVFFVTAFLQPLWTHNETIRNLNGELADRQRELAQKQAERRDLNRLRALSLPADPEARHEAYEMAWNEYDKYLWKLVRDNRLQSVVVRRGAPPVTKIDRGGRAVANKKPVFLPLTYTVEATGELTSLVALLDDFYRTPLLHQIKTLSVKPAGGDGRKPRPGSRELALKMTVEALILDGAEKRPFLMPLDQRMLAVNGLLALRHAPAGLPLVPWSADNTGLLRPVPLTTPATPGQYAEISRKNVFFAPIPPRVEPSKPRIYPEVNRNDHIRLTSIIHTGETWHAFIYDVFHDKRTRLWASERQFLWFEQKRMLRAFQTFVLYDSEGEKHTAWVYRIDPQDVYFQYEGKYYRLRIGDTVSDAMNEAVSRSEVKALGLPRPAGDEDED